MSEHEPHDPWASLAESLGAQPASEPTPPRPPAAPRPAAKPRTEPKPRSPAPAAGDWDSLASELGLGGGATEPPRPAPRPAAPPRAAHDVRDREPPPQRPRVEPIRDDHDRDTRDFDGPAATHAAEAEDRGEQRADGERRDDDGGERRGRRRRGRRGGRGRGRRDDDRLPRADDRGSATDREPRGRNEDRTRDEGAALPPRRQPDDTFDQRDEHAADLFAPAEEGDRGMAAEPRSGDLDPQRDEEGRPRRRRRRGRRGGRSRGRTDSREPVADDRGDAQARRTDDAHDDEPLPSGYGVRPAPRPADAGPRAEGEAAEGEGRGRRRRRRRGGEGRSGARREAGGEPKGAGRSSQERRSRRSSSGEPRGSSSTLSRGRRADFKPVNDGYDEDDEGLDFLGIEEAGRDTPRRESRPEDDEILAESGLDSVRDVPSWVEAIGIVIAGNLDARSRPRGDDSRRSDGGRR